MFNFSIIFIRHQIIRIWQWEHVPSMRWMQWLMSLCAAHSGESKSTFIEIAPESLCRNNTIVGELHMLEEWYECRRAKDGTANHWPFDPFPTPPFALLYCITGTKIPIFHCQMALLLGAALAVAASLLRFQLPSPPSKHPNTALTVYASHQTAPASGLWSHHLLLALWPASGGYFLLLLISRPHHSLFGFLGLPSAVQAIPSINVPLFAWLDFIWFPELPT